METLENLQTWDIVSRESAGDKNILNTTWAYKAKHFPDGQLQKMKAGIFVRGDQQRHGHNFFDSYALVVS